MTARPASSELEPPRRLRALESAARAGTFGAAASQLGEAGLALMVVLAALPFLQPVPMAGLSTPAGLFVAAQGARLASGRRSLWMPRRLARRALDPRLAGAVAGGAARVAGWLERLGRPRWRALARAERATGLGLVAGGLLLASPVPLPFGNPASAAPVCLLAIGLLEEDGRASALGWAGLAASAAYHAAVYALGAAGVRALLRGAA